MDRFSSEYLEKTSLIIDDFTKYLFSFATKEMQTEIFKLGNKIQSLPFIYKGKLYGEKQEFNISPKFLPFSEAKNFQKLLDKHQLDRDHCSEITSWLKTIASKRSINYVIALIESLNYMPPFIQDNYNEIFVSPADVKIEFKDHPTYKLIQMRMLITKME